MAAFNIKGVARVELVGDDRNSLSEQALILFRAVRASQLAAGVKPSTDATVNHYHRPLAKLTANEHGDIVWTEIYDASGR